MSKPAWNVGAWNFDPTYMDIANVNMYGFTPCPKCKEPYRCSFNNDPGIVVCDDCGFKEPVVCKPDEEAEAP